MSSRYIDSAYLQTTTGNDGLTPSNLILDGGAGQSNSAPATTATATFAPIFVAHLDAFSIAFATLGSSTLVGTLTLQASNDRSMKEQTGAPDVNLIDWQAISFWDVGAGAQAASKAVASGAQTLLLAERNCTYRWARLVFTFTSGTGSPRSLIQQKGWP